MAQTCNGGDVSVFTCFPARGEDTGYVLYVRTEDQTRIDYFTLEFNCVP